MNLLIDELFKKARSNDENVSSNAITDLSFALEMHAWHLSKDERLNRYDSLVSQEIIELDINESDQAEIVNFLRDEIENGSKLTANLLFAMGQASAKVGLLPLIDIMEKHLDRFNENEFYQALISLERAIYFDESLSLEEERDILAKTNLLNTISRKILSFQPISHSDLTSTSLRLLARMILLLNDSTELDKEAGERSLTITS